MSCGKVRYKDRTGGCGCGCKSGGCGCGPSCPNCDCNSNATVMFGGTANSLNGSKARRCGGKVLRPKIGGMRRRIGGAVSPPRSLPNDMTSMESKMISLWDDHAMYTIFVLMSKVAQGGATQPMTARLLANQDQIGYMFLPKFGAAAADQVASLLREHILRADAVIDAVGQPTYDAANKRWYDNAEEIGASLFDLQSKGGPYLMSRDSWITAMRTHLDTLTAVVAAYKGDQYGTAVEAIDPYVKHIRHLAMAVAKLVSGRLIPQFGYVIGAPPSPYYRFPGPQYVYRPRIQSLPVSVPRAPLIPDYPPWLSTPLPPYRFPTRTTYFPYD